MLNDLPFDVTRHIAILLNSGDRATLRAVNHSLNHVVARIISPAQQQLNIALNNVVRELVAEATFQTASAPEQVLETNPELLTKFLAAYLAVLSGYLLEPDYVSIARVYTTYKRIIDRAIRLGTAAGGGGNAALALTVSKIVVLSTQAGLVLPSTTRAVQTGNG